MITTNINIDSFASNFVPSVYISKIVLDTPNTKKQNESLSLEVGCSMPVVKSAKTDETFYANAKTREFMSIKVVASCDRDQIAFLKTLNSYQFCKVVEKLNDLYVHTIGLADLPPTLDSFQSEIKNGQEVSNVVFSADLKIEKNNLNDVTVFVVPFFDKTKIENSFSTTLDLSNLISSGDLSRCYGKLVIEDVIKAGETQTEAVYYEDSQGSLWLGDVILEDNKPVKFTTQGPGGSLTEKKTFNSSLHDYRVKKQIEDTFINLNDSVKLFSTNRVGASNLPPNVEYTAKDFSKDQKAGSPVYFSNAMVTSNKDGDVKVLFAVNSRELFYQLSSFGKLWDNMLPGQKNVVLPPDGVLFKSLKLVRKRIESETNDNLWNTIGKRPEKEELIAILGEEETDTGSIKSIKVDLLEQPDQQENYFFFSAVDTQVSSRNYGFYQYGVKFVFEDRIKSFLESQLNLLASYYKSLADYYCIASSPSSYIISSGKFSLSFSTNNQEDYSNLISNALASFIGTHQLLFGGDYKQKQNMAKLLINLSSPTTGTQKGLLLVLNIFENLTHKLSELLGIKNLSSPQPDNTTSYAPQGIKSFNQKHFIEREHFFGEVYNSYNSSKKGYEFLSLPTETPDETLGISMLDYDTYEQRVNFETSKYFKSLVGTFNITLYQNKKNTNTTVSKNLETSKFTFLTPTMISAPDDTIYNSIDENGVIDYGKLNLAYLSILKDKLNSLDPTFKVSGKMFTNLTFEEKKQKYQLNEIFGLKGGSYVTTETEGVTLFDMMNDNSQNTPFSTNSSAELQPSSSVQELPILSPEQIDEPNFNDSLFFLSSVQEEGDISNFHSFLSAINGKYDEAKGQQKFLVSAIEKFIPNQYVHLLALNNTSNLSNSSDLKNILEVTEDPGTSKTNALEKSDTLEKSFGIWLNYFNVAAVEYLAGFANNETKEPYFRPLTADTFNSIRSNNQTVMCRMRIYYDNDFQIKESQDLNLPTLNRYFMIAPAGFQGLVTQPNPTNDTAETIFKMSQHNTTILNVPTVSLNSSMSVDSLIIAKENAPKPVGKPNERLEQERFTESTATGTRTTSPGSGGGGGGY